MNNDQAQVEVEAAELLMGNIFSGALEQPTRKGLVEIEVEVEVEIEPDGVVEVEE
jgi:hypothetical protein